MDAVAEHDLSEFSPGDVEASSGGDGFEELVGAQARGAKRFHHCYWKRPDGYITVQAYYGDEMATMMERGMTPLLQYGRFQLRSRGFDAHGKDQWKLILERGGAKEFTPEQIVELGWHKKAPYRAKFAQLKTHPVHEVTCPVCRKVIASLSPEQAQVLLGKHQSIAHKDVSHEQSLGRALASAMTEAQKTGNDQMAQVLSAVVELIDKQNKQIAALSTRIDGKR
ncbi:MAG: hypothetical protein KGL39_05405 [Patescibacteria group bacterium]|nr:hypothetical protein [Patescibacteria group bacterium]